MKNSVYQINKGINKSIEFKGLKAQYIWYMGGVMLVLMLAFMILYMIGFNQYLSLALTGTGGFILTRKIFSMSKKYGEHGLMKLMARKSIPRTVKSKDRSLFIKLKKSTV